MKKHIKSKVIFLSVLLLNSIICSAQSLDELDNLNGFKQFKFGLSPKQIENITPSANDLPLKNVSWYNYTGKDISTFGGATVSKISLSFYKNRLYRVMVSYGNRSNPFTADQFNVIRDIFSSSFGKKYYPLSDVEDMTILNGIAWISKSIRLDFLRMSYKDQVGGYALFYHLETDLLQQKDELK
jgi:hypothetical protein